MKKAFTLIELLVIVAIMGTMVTVGVVSFTSGRASTSIFAAARDVMAVVSRARSTALVTQKPVVVIFSNGKTADGDEVAAKVEIKAEKFFNSQKSKKAIQNLAGDIIVEGEEPEVETKKRKLVIIEREGEDASADVEDESEAGETIEEVLSPTQISEEVMKGLKIKVVEQDEEFFVPESETKRSKISIFSTAGAVARSYEVTSTTKKSEEEEAIDEEDMDETKEIVFNVNGTVKPPHKIWVYPEGSKPEQGLCIEVDRYGEAKCQGVEGL